MPSSQTGIIEKTKFIYSSLRKAFEKQVRTIESHGEKQIKAIDKNLKQLVASITNKKIWLWWWKPRTSKQKNIYWSCCKKARWNIKIKQRN